MNRAALDRARQLAAELEQRFAQDADPARKLDAHERLQRANDRLRCRMHPDALYGEHPAAVDAAVAEKRSEVLGAPDPLQAIQHVHWQIHQAHRNNQQVAEDRRHRAVGIGEITRRGVSPPILPTPRADSASSPRAIDIARVRVQPAPRDRGPAS